MKINLLSLTFMLVFLPIKAQQLPKQLHNLEHSKDSTYGYTLQNPIFLKTGNLKKSLQSARTFFTCLSTDSGSELSIIEEEEIVRVNEYNLIYYGSNGTTYILPKQTNFLYKFTLSDGQSTITLFIEPSIATRNMKPNIPVGLKIKL